MRDSNSQVCRVLKVQKCHLITAHLETTEDRRVLPHVRRTGESFAIAEVQFLDIYKLGQTGNVA